MARHGPAVAGRPRTRNNQQLEPGLLGALLLGEYYHATGDRNVLPYLKNLVDWAR
jgi:hypothetical protein